VTWKCGTSQTMTHHLEGRKREEQVGELGNVACHKRGLTHWRGGRGRSGLVNTWNWGTSQTMTHLLEGRKREERVGELGNVARHKQGLTNWRGGRGKSGLVSVTGVLLPTGSYCGAKSQDIPRC